MISKLITWGRGGLLIDCDGVRLEVVVCMERTHAVFSLESQRSDRG